MTIGSYACGGARIVRWVTVALAIVLVVGVLAVHAFASRYGHTTSPVSVRPSVSDVPVSVVTAGLAP